MSLGGPGLGGGGAGFAAAGAGFAAAASGLAAGAVPANRVNIQRSTAIVFEQTLASITELYLINRRETQIMKRPRPKYSRFPAAGFGPILTKIPWELYPIISAFCLLFLNSLC